MLPIPASRSSRALLLAAATAPALASAAVTSPAHAAAPAPHLSVAWQTLHLACPENHRAGPCRERSSHVRGGTVHLRWHQHGRIEGRLSLAGAPTVGAHIAFKQLIPHHHARTEVLTTSANGRFSARFRGPSGRVELSYTTATGRVLTNTRRVSAKAYLSLHIAKLRAGHRAHFYGRVAGGFTPEDLYIQFWYYAGRSSGYQPFAHLALVNRKTGRWSIHVPIPRDTAGFHYRIHASIVASPHWPWATTNSPTVRRLVS